MRCTYRVLYFNFRPDEAIYVPIAALEVRMREPFTAPKQGHLSLTTGDKDMAILYTSSSSRTPQVRYGPSSKELIASANGTTTTYSFNDMFVFTKWMVKYIISLTARFEMV